TTPHHTTPHHTHTHTHHTPHTHTHHTTHLHTHTHVLHVHIHTHTHTHTQTQTHTHTSAFHTAETKHTQSSRGHRVQRGPCISVTRLSRGPLNTTERGRTQRGDREELRRSNDKA